MLEEDCSGAVPMNDVPAGPGPALTCSVLVHRQARSRAEAASVQPAYAANPSSAAKILFFITLPPVDRPVGPADLIGRIDPGGAPWLSRCMARWPSGHTGWRGTLSGEGSWAVLEGWQCRASGWQWRCHGTPRDPGKVCVCGVCMWKLGGSHEVSWDTSASHPSAALGRPAFFCLGIVWGPCSGPGQRGSGKRSGMRFPVGCFIGPKCPVGRAALIYPGPGGLPIFEQVSVVSFPGGVQALHVTYEGNPWKKEC